MDDQFIGLPDALKCMDTYGLPLEIMMEECEKQDATDGRKTRPALDLFVRDAVNSGWTFKHAIAVCRDALIAKYGIQIGQRQADRLENGMKVHCKRYWPNVEVPPAEVR